MARKLNVVDCDKAVVWREWVATATSRATADVPCGSCMACCRSRMFVHVGPTETATLKSIPQELLFEAPGLAKGYQLLGFDQEGCCPMVADTGCSIYEDRPVTCRRFDCRVLAAAEVYPEDKPLLADQGRRWVFHYASDEELEEHERIKTAAHFLKEHRARFEGGVIPRNEVQLAALSLGVADLFEDEVEPGERLRRVADRLERSSSARGGQVDDGAV